MATDTKPLGQQYHEAVEALKSKGSSNADAIREVAAQFGKEVNAVRGGIHQYKAKNHGTAGTPPRGRRTAEASVDDLLATAKQSLEAALALVDREVEQAKLGLEKAQAHYETVVASVKDRKADIQKKLKALS